MPSVQEQAPEDARLIPQAQQGDTEAFRTLYDRYARLIYRYIAVRVGNPQDAEDLTAETFIKAWRNLSAYEFRGAPFGAWLLRIAHNLVIDRYRQKRDPQQWLPWHQRPEESSRLDWADHRDEIRRAISSLSYLEQVIVHMRFFEGYSLKEVAEYVDKTPNAVRVAQSRALKRLRKVIESDRA